MKKINITPIPKPRMTQSDKWKKRACVVRYYKMKDFLRLALPEYIDNLPEILPPITFCLPFPKSYSQKKRNKLRSQPHRIKPDLDNLIKGFKDCFGEDSSVHTYEKMCKIWSDEGSIIIH